MKKNSWITAGLIWLLGFSILSAQSATIERVSIATDGTQSDRASYDKSISASGRYIAFDSHASLAPEDMDLAYDIYVYDRSTRTLELITGTANNDCSLPSISGDGRYVAFRSTATNLVPQDTDTLTDIYVYDRDTGVTELISRSDDVTKGNGGSHFPHISAEGRYVAFNSIASNLHPGDTDTIADIYVYDRDTSTLELISHNGDESGNGNSHDAFVSADGRYVAFRSYASNLHPDDPDAIADIFFYDRDTSTLELISHNSDQSGNGDSRAPVISVDGRYVAFYSQAANLHPDDTDSNYDVYLYDRDTSTLELISRSEDGSKGNGNGGSASISADGRYVAFNSNSTNLHPDDTDTFGDIYIYDRNTDSLTLASYNGTVSGNNSSYAPQISADGRLVAYTSFATNLVENDTNESRDIFVSELELDTDGDGLKDALDNCPEIFNPGQEDNDIGDGIDGGDACDSDDDNDGVPDYDLSGARLDNCVYTYNPGQSDSDGDGEGDACDGDLDGDGIANDIDSCPDIPNEGSDIDGDGIDSVCDPDDDGDGVADSFPDNCPLTFNPDQADLDGDSIGDACDADIDADTVLNSDDNCPRAANIDQTDTDLDGEGDACDTNDDNDAYPDSQDNCQFVQNDDQADIDDDGLGDACDFVDDRDGDGDGIIDLDDNCPTVPNPNQADFDGDGLGDVCDNDDDADKVVDLVDECPLTAPGALVNPDNGCSLDQQCPCEGPAGSTEPWRNHGKFVSCMAYASNALVELGLLSEEDKEAVMAEAGSSDCGRKQR